MKVAYLMLVHRNPQLLKRAIARLSTESSAFFIHIDLKSDIRQFSVVGCDNVFLSKQRIPVYWGEFSQVEATMGLIREALACSANYGYFVFLQGSDYPLRGGNYIQAFLEENSGSEFINIAKMPAPGYPLSKINKLRYPSDEPVHRFISRALAKVGLAQRDYRRYLEGLEAFAGQAWWTLSRDACEHIVDFAESNPQVERFFRNTFTADEMFFHTILGNSRFYRQRRKSLVFVDTTWAITGDRRHLVNHDHVKLFEEQEKVWVENEWGAGEVLFARKFSDETLDVVDRIDRMIEGKELRAARG